MAAVQLALRSAQRSFRWRLLDTERMLRILMTWLSPAVQSVLELFKGPLCSVRFAAIDADGLTTMAAEVEAAATDVRHQEAKLAELRQKLGQRQEALLLLAQQALAYARVYAENSDEQLLEELNRISLPRAAKPRKPSGKAAGLHDTHRSDAQPAEAQQTQPGAETAESAESGDSAAAEAVQTAPPRNERKGRGRTAQPSAS